MNPLRVVEGTMVALDRADVDTDQIMPKQFLKRVERTGYGEYVFHDWRSDPEFCLNDPRRSDAKILVTGPNFGCGSSREHAPWGLQQWGFDAIVAPSFADIFRNNCAKTGLLAVTLPPDVCGRLMALAEADPNALCTIDLEANRLVAGDITAELSIDGHTRRLLLEGLDDIALTLRHGEAIADFEATRPAWMPATASA